MKPDLEIGGLKLTEEEAFSLLGLCLTSPNRLDAISEKALRKLAEYCSHRSNYSDHHRNGVSSNPCLSGELAKIGA